MADARFGVFLALSLSADLASRLSRRSARSLFSLGSVLFPRGWIIRLAYHMGRLYFSLFIISSSHHTFTMRDPPPPPPCPGYRRHADLVQACNRRPFSINFHAFSFNSKLLACPTPHHPPCSRGMALGRNRQIWLANGPARRDRSRTGGSEGLGARRGGEAASARCAGAWQCVWGINNRVRNSRGGAPHTFLITLRHYWKKCARGRSAASPACRSTA